MKKRRYGVSGIDEDGDVHLLCADDRQHAQEVAEEMREDLSEVKMEEMQR